MCPSFIYANTDSLNRLSRNQVETRRPSDVASTSAFELCRCRRSVSCSLEGQSESQHRIEGHSHCCWPTPTIAGHKLWLSAAMAWLKSLARIGNSAQCGG